MNHLICGRMKQGKTTLAIHLGKKMSGGVVVFDPRCMVDGIICWSPEELDNAIEQYSNEKSTVPIVYRFDSGDVATEFQKVCDVIFPPRFTRRNFTLVVDEAASLQSSNRIHPGLDRAIRQHPRSVEIIQTTHSLQDWYRSSRDLVCDIYCFCMIGRSLDAVVDFCDGDKDMEDAIKNLPPHHYLHYNVPSAQYVVMGKPEKWFAQVVEDDSRVESTIQ